MKKFEDKETGFTVIVTNDKVKIEMPIKSLINCFESNPENYDGDKIKRGMRKQFAEWTARNLLDSVDSEKGDNHIVEMLDRLYETALENAEEFIQFAYEENKD